MIEIADRMMKSPHPISQAITKVRKALKNLFSKIKKIKTSSDVSQQNVGALYLFLLKSKDGMMYAPKEDDCRIAFVFVNKLDALIFSLFIREQEPDSLHYDVVSVNSDQVYLKALKTLHQAGKLKFRIILGFSGIMTPLGPKWAKTDDMKTPLLSVREGTWQEVEEGYDLSYYLNYLEGEKAREAAMSCLINTNFASMEELLHSAQQLITDMAINSQVVEENNPRLYHRLVFMG